MKLFYDAREILLKYRIRHANAFSADLFEFLDIRGPDTPEDVAFHLVFLNDLHKLRDLAVLHADKVQMQITGTDGDTKILDVVPMPHDDIPDQWYV